MVGVVERNQRVLPGEHLAGRLGGRRHPSDAATIVRRPVDVCRWSHLG